MQNNTFFDNGGPAGWMHIWTRIYLGKNAPDPHSGILSVQTVSWQELVWYLGPDCTSASSIYVHLAKIYALHGILFGTYAFSLSLRIGIDIIRVEVIFLPLHE